MKQSFSSCLTWIFQSSAEARAWARGLPTLVVLALGLASAPNGSAQTSAAYGTINNFDVVNGTGTNCHGFDIEIEDVYSTNITYTYSWNHYGTPTITEDTSNPLHSRVLVRYASARSNGIWTAYTAVPTNAIPPTQGHQFTNPSVNFGGEHFGVGYYGQPTNITYYWLVDDGAGGLVRAQSVNVATPTFTYYPPAAGAPAQVRAVIAAPPAPRVQEYGPATWVKEIKTAAHNNRAVQLRDLVSDDPDDADDRNWRNGEPAEVELEWKILQTRFTRQDGGRNANLEARPEDLPGGDEVITRRYEFYKYVGPLDPESGEALTEDVGADGIHGINQYSNTVVVGLYLGAQMSAFDVGAHVGLIEQLQDGVVDVPYPHRTVVIGGNNPFIATNSGALPAGMTFNNVTGELSGTPTASGVFSFTVGATAGNDPPVRRTYTLTIAPSIDAAAALPPRSTVDTVASPLDSGTTTGNATYTNGTTATVTATPALGFVFANWTENGKVVSTSASYTFTNVVNRSLVAYFVPGGPRLSVSVPQPGTLALTWPTNVAGFMLQRATDLTTLNWTTATNAISAVGSNNRVIIAPVTGQSLFRLAKPQP